MVEPVKANAVYSYAGGNTDELPFAEGDELSIIDRSEADWWKAERDGIVFIVPAAYLEIVEGTGVPQRVNPREKTSTNLDIVECPDMSGAAAARGSPDKDDHADSSSDGGEDYFSLDGTDDDSEGSDAGTVEDEDARELERQRVLEAAGLIIDTSSSMMAPSDPPVQKRRPPPVTPHRVSIVSATSKNLPPVPTVDLTDTELDSTSRLDDAFDRYEVFKKTNGNLTNRMSVSSFDTSPSSPPRSPVVSLAPSLNHRDGESRTSQFLSFLGRHTTRSTTPEPEKKTLVISGPIINTPPGGEIGDDGSSFGTSWASLVDKSALEGIPKMERRRQEAIFELIFTEADYVRDLQLIVGLFYSRLMGTLGEKATTVIFANIEDILLTNTTFLSVLEERQKDCRLYIDHIGDVLETHIPNMHLYLVCGCLVCVTLVFTFLESYCVNQFNAAKVLQSMRDSDPDLAAQLQRLRDDPSARNLDLSHYLLVPMQRLTRYPLLIRQILQYTDPPTTTNADIKTTTSAHPPAISLQLPSDAKERRNIIAALDAAEKILEHVNETIREQEGRERLSEISKDLWIGQGRLNLTAPTRHLGPRKLLKEGVVSKAKSGRKLRLFLCSDILVLTDDVGRGLYRVPIPLNEVQIKGSRTEREDSVLRLHLAYPRGGDTIVLRATSIKDSLAWKDAIERASRRAKEGERRAAKAQLVSSKTDLQLS
ncbi:Rho family DH domain-containing guanine nucleotide exchange factor [Suillus paluster]|uniref:Rho family DH domain-containing guanine nucleotide exchange factor n=1 Tax=Suillus paluster TaxID=48578 RepID=UPI001B879737|nr:Rho family DH domain-containing guanine nucleotide exchange factor [Suillus paluster]KAG1741756.1 Dbl homology domain-containing protein [Suillus paluster]